MDAETLVNWRKLNRDWVDLFYMLCDEFHTLTAEQRRELRRQMDELRQRITVMEEADAGVE